MIVLQFQLNLFQLLVKFTQSARINWFFFFNLFLRFLTFNICNFRWLLWFPSCKSDWLYFDNPKFLLSLFGFLNLSANFISKFNILNVFFLIRDSCVIFIYQLVLGNNTWKYIYKLLSLRNIWLKRHWLVSQTEVTSAKYFCFLVRYRLLRQSQQLLDVIKVRLTHYYL